ncbi:YkvA family protein [Microcoleus sp. bin48.metabat.b7b8b9.023]|uniref:YkvA family protein n=1 Tax=unclassified Microcoleus TaxID=2642155 RepID=UPI0034553F6C
MPYAQLVISFYMQSLKQAARQLKKETYAVYLASRDQRVPWYARVLAGVTVAYAFSPIDLIPDFIPILGYLDDLIIVPLGIWLVIKMIPPQVLAECREKAVAEIERGKPINRTVAAVIIAIWIGLGILAAIWIKQIFKR